MAHKFCQKRAANRRGRPAAAVLMALLLFFMPSLGGLDLAHAEYTPPVQLQSQGVYLINLDSDMVIYQKNASQKMYPSWLTMIMTAILVMENVEDLDSTVVTANQWMFDEFYGYSVPTRLASRRGKNCPCASCCIVCCSNPPARRPMWRPIMWATRASHILWI